MRFLVTGAAGFIGFHVARRLLGRGHFVSGLDGFTPHYDVRLKRARFARLAAASSFCAREAMLEDYPALEAIAAKDQPEIIVHLAAQAGVRGGLEYPRIYADANLTGMFNVLEIAKALRIHHLLFASTSSVYGDDAEAPFCETMRTDHPLSLYAATKKAGEDMAHAYAHLWKMPTTALRIFTAYGPWGRPDMAIFKFVHAALKGEPIEVFGEGKMARDFTFIDDLVEAIVRLVERPPREGDYVGSFDSLSPTGPYRVVNIGSGRPVSLLEVIDAIDARLGTTLEWRPGAAQKGEVQKTWAANDLLCELTGFAPSTSLKDGVDAFATWYRNFYDI